MTARRDAQIAAAVLAMRSPLARVELLASQLARSASKPADQQLAHGISSAVAELDRQIDASLRALAPAPPRARVDCRPVLELVHARLEAVLRARGVVVRLRLPEQSVPGDPEATRHAALGLLRAGLCLCGRGAELVLGLVGEGRRYGIALEPAPARGAAPLPAAVPGSDPFAPLRALALAQGGELEQSAAGGAVLWLGGEPAS